MQNAEVSKKKGREIGQRRSARRVWEVTEERWITRLRRQWRSLGGYASVMAGAPVLLDK